jgi:hypothetical protein
MHAGPAAGSTRPRRAQHPPHQWVAELAHPLHQRVIAERYARRAQTGGRIVLNRHDVQIVDLYCSVCGQSIPGQASCTPRRV